MRKFDEVVPRDPGVVRAWWCGESTVSLMISGGCTRLVSIYVQYLAHVERKQDVEEENLRIYST